MALAGWEWIVIAGVLIVFFLWGPNKIPDLARAIGQARREFERLLKKSPIRLKHRHRHATVAPPLDRR